MRKSLLIFVAILSVSYVYSQGEHLPFDKELNKVVFVKIDSSDLSLSDLNKKTKEWINEGWKSYKDVVSFEADDKFIINGITRISEVGCAYRITINLKDNKYRIAFDNIRTRYNYGEYQSAEDTWIEYNKLIESEREKGKKLKGYNGVLLRANKGYIDIINILIYSLIENYQKKVSDLNSSDW